MPRCDHCGLEIAPGRPCIACVEAAAALTVANLQQVAMRRRREHPRGRACRCCLPPDEAESGGVDDGGGWEGSGTREALRSTRVRLLDRATAVQAKAEIMVREEQARRRSLTQRPGHDLASTPYPNLHPQPRF